MKKIKMMKKSYHTPEVKVYMMDPEELLDQFHGPSGEGVKVYDKDGKPTTDSPGFSNGTTNNTWGQVTGSDGTTSWEEAE